MKKIFSLWNALFFFSFLLCGCSDNEGHDTPPPAEIELSDDTSDHQEIFADETTPGDKGISFVTQGPWKAVVEEVVKTKAGASPADWVVLSQYSGDKAGSYTITVTLMPNFTGKERQAVIRIICGDTEITITVVQKGVAESGTAPRIVKEIVLTEEHGKDANINWGKPQTNIISYFYDERGRVAKITRDKRVENDESENRFLTFTFDYDVVGEISINKTEKGENSIEKMLAKLDNLGRIVKVEGTYNSHSSELDAYEFGYNEAGQLAKMTYISGIDKGSWDKYEYTDGMLNKITSWWNHEEEVSEVPIDQLYPNRYSANTTNIDLNSMEGALGEEVLDFLYGMRLFGMGSKCLMEISMLYGDEDEELSGESSMGYPNPNQVIPKQYKYIKKRENSFDRQFYEFDANNYVTKSYSHQPYDIMLQTYDIVVGSEPVYPDYPEAGYKGEIKNHKVTKVGEDKNTYTYTVKYQD